MPYLEIKLGPDAMLLRFVGRIDYVFGRLPRADVQLRDMKVSRLHSQLFLDSRGDAWVRDLGSSTGTIVGARRLRKGGVAPLTDGVTLKIGGARITYRDAQPPANALQPPGRSEPRGLIRTNQRDRHIEGDATVLAAEKVDEGDRAGPAEPPPDVNPAAFAGEPEPRKEAAAEAAEAGIVEAPWDKPGSAPSAREEMVSLAAGRSPTPPGAEHQETGHNEPEHPATVIDDTGESRLLPEDTADLMVDETTGAEPPEDAGAAFSRPAEFRAPPPGDPEDEVPPLGMPTIRIDKPQIDERKQAVEEDKPAKNKIPTTRLDKASIEERRLQQEEESESEVAPVIGKPVTAGDLKGQTFGWQDGAPPGGNLEEIEEVDFGDESSEDEDADEVRFGAGARFDLADDSIDIEDSDPDSAGEADMEANKDLPGEDDDQDDTQSPPARQGATPDRTFKPRKTRKLMKHRPGTGKITDKTNPTPPPGGEKTALVTDQPITQGADTVFLPKPGESADDYARGPGGDTMALPKDMMKELRDELKESGKEPATSKEGPPVEEGEDEVEGNDFMAETEDLPASRKRPNDDTIVE